MVDYTFRQLMMQAGMDSIAEAGFHCNVCIVEDGASLLIYVLYAEAGRYIGSRIQ